MQSDEVLRMPFDFEKRPTTPPKNFETVSSLAETVMKIKSHASRDVLWKFDDFDATF